MVRSHLKNIFLRLVIDFMFVDIRRKQKRKEEIPEKSVDELFLLLESPLHKCKYNIRAE
jgi:hypothetical protein